MIWHLNTLQGDHHKSSYCWSPYKVFTILPTIFFILFVINTFLWLVYFVTGNLHLICLFSHLLSGKYQFAPLWACFCFGLFVHLLCVSHDWKFKKYIQEFKWCHQGPVTLSKFWHCLSLPGFISLIYSFHIAGSFGLWLDITL